MPRDVWCQISYNPPYVQSLFFIILPLTIKVSSKMPDRSAEKSFYVLFQKTFMKSDGSGLVKKNIIFITDDAKEDWWLTIHGRTISPRKELYSEFLEKTKQKILIYRPDIFMKYAKDKFNSRLDDDAINEIINISTFISSYIKPNNPHNSDYLKYLLRLKNLQKLMPLDEKTLRDLISLEDYKSFINLKYHNNYTYLDEDSARLEAMLRSSVKIEDYIRSIQNESKKGNQNSPKDDESEDDDLEEKRSKED